MDEIKIKVDFDKKEIHGMECEYEDKFEVAKVLLNVATGIFNKVLLKPKGKIEVVKPKIIGGSK